MNSGWYEYDERYGVKVYRNPKHFDNIPYRCLTKEDAPLQPSQHFDLFKIIAYLLNTHNKTYDDISHVVYTIDERTFRCNFDDFKSYIEQCSDFRDILSKDIVIKGNGDWWIHYECLGLWDFFLIERPFDPAVISLAQSIVNAPTV
jgi:hypothetical protein